MLVLLIESDAGQIVSSSEFADLVTEALPMLLPVLLAWLYPALLLHLATCPGTITH